MAEMRETFEKVKKNDEILHGDVLPRLKEVERLQEEVTREMTAMRASQTSLELTVMKESQTNRQQVDKLESTLVEIVRTALGIQSTRNTQAHEFKMAKWNHVANILVKFSGVLTLLLGSGTGIYLIIEHYFGK